MSKPKIEKYKDGYWLSLESGWVYLGEKRRPAKRRAAALKKLINGGGK